MAINYGVTLLSIIVLTSSTSFSAALPLLSESQQERRPLSHDISSKPLSNAYESLYAPRVTPSQGAPDAKSAADAITSLLIDQMNTASKYSPSQVPVDDESLLLQQLSPLPLSPRVRGKRSGMSDQKLAEIETLLALKLLLQEQRGQYGYGVIDPEKLGRR